MVRKGGGGGGGGGVGAGVVSKKVSRLDWPAKKDFAKVP